MQLPLGAQVWNAAGVDAAWDSQTHLLANVVDKLSVANWQRTGRQQGKPKPVPRPAESAKKTSANERHIEQARRFQERHQSS